MKYLRLLRPADWAKNLFVFAAVVFGGKLEGMLPEVFIAFASALGAFVCFSLAGSGIYIFNDIIDRHTDRKHPVKSNRPIASGQIDIGQAVILSVLCCLLGLGGAYLLSVKLFFVIAIYILMMVFYSLLFKRVMILDCIVISIGFCLRAIAGAVAVGVLISPWLIICTFCLCLFLGFGKRRCEIAQLESADALVYRNTLVGYTPELLNHMLDVTSGLAVVCFLIYGMSERTLENFGSNNLVYTTPFVLYCVFRFSMLIQKGRFTGPVQIIWKDRAFQLGLVLWVLFCIGIIYFSWDFSSLWSY
jgi:4-hydroxybenzoate polyprenyltransferase